LIPQLLASKADDDFNINARELKQLEVRCDNHIGINGNRRPGRTLFENPERYLDGRAYVPIRQTLLPITNLITNPGLFSGFLIADLPESPLPE